MALEIVLTRTSQSSDGTTLVITDNTGSVSATAYGVGGNQARSTLQLSLFVNLRKSTGRETIAVPASVASTVASWSITIAEDGWYEFYGFGCLIYDAGITYAAGEIVYVVADAAYYVSQSAGNIGQATSDDTYWVATTDVEDFTAAVALGQSDVYEVTLNSLEQYLSLKGEATMLFEAECDNCIPCQLGEYEKVRMKLEAANIHFASPNYNYSGAQEIMENVQDILDRLEDN